MALPRPFWNCRHIRVNCCTVPNGITATPFVACDPSTCCVAVPVFAIHSYGHHVGGAPRATKCAAGCARNTPPATFIMSMPIESSTIKPEWPVRGVYWAVNDGIAMPLSHNLLIVAHMAFPSRQCRGIIAVVCGPCLVAWLQDTLRFVLVVRGNDCWTARRGGAMNGSASCVATFARNNIPVWPIPTRWPLRRPWPCRRISKVGP